MTTVNESSQPQVEDNMADDIAGITGFQLVIDGKKVTKVLSDDTGSVSKTLKDAVLAKLMRSHGPLESDKFGYLLKPDSRYHKALKPELTKESDCGIVVVGPSQHGKSTLINFILKGERVPKTQSIINVGNGNESCTTHCTVCTSTFNGISKTLQAKITKYDIIDTPGLLDSSRENEFLNSLAIHDTITELKEKRKKINCVVLVLKHDTNISDDLLSALRTYQLLLGDLFEETLCIVFTHVSYSPEIVLQLEEDGVDREALLKESVMKLKAGLGLRNDPKYFALNAKPFYAVDIQRALDAREFILDLASQTPPFENVEARIAKTTDMLIKDKIKIGRVEGDLKGYLESYEQSIEETDGRKGTLSTLSEEIERVEEKLDEYAVSLGKLVNDPNAIATQKSMTPINKNKWRKAWPWKKAVIEGEFLVDIHDFQLMNCHVEKGSMKIDRNTGSIVVFSRFMRSFQHSEVRVRAKKIMLRASEIEALQEKIKDAKEHLKCLNSDQKKELEIYTENNVTKNRLHSKIDSARSTLSKLRSPFLSVQEALARVTDSRVRRRLEYINYDCERVNIR